MLATKLIYIAVASLWVRLISRLNWPASLVNKLYYNHYNILYRYNGESLVCKRCEPILHSGLDQFLTQCLLLVLTVGKQLFPRVDSTSVDWDNDPNRSNRVIKTGTLLE